MLADQLDAVIGADTHRDSDTLAVVRARDGATLAIERVATTLAGYRSALAFADQHVPGARAWALEGSNAYGAGLARFLIERGERVIEVDRPARIEQHSHAKSDELDAIRAARTALGSDDQATPRIGESHHALRVLQSTRNGAVAARTAAINELHALVVTAPEALRRRLRDLPVAALLVRARALRVRPATVRDERCTIIALRHLAQRIELLTREEEALRKELAILVKDVAPALLEEPGVGPISAAQILISWAHAGRVHSEAAFAHLAGAAPIPASSGQTIRYRLDRGGDRQLNRALHTVAQSRIRHDERTIAYAERQQHRGKTRRETLRLLKRYLARHFYRLLERSTTPLAPAPTGTAG
jgi:transposase